MPLNSRSHVAIVQDANGVHLYKDGVLQGSPLNNTQLREETDQNADISAFTVNFSSFARHLDGTIDEFRIWDHARREEQLRHWRGCALAGKEPGLVVYYDMNEGIPGGDNAGQDTAGDSSGNGDDGSLQNFSLSGSSSNWVSNCSGFGWTCAEPVPATSRWAAHLLGSLFLAMGGVALRAWRLDGAALPPGVGVRGRSRAIVRASGRSPSWPEHGSATQLFVAQ